MLVRRVVVEHQVDLEGGRHARVDVREEREELLMAVPPLALRQDLATLHVEGREARRRAVPDVAVGDALQVAEPHGQWRGAHECQVATRLIALSRSLITGTTRVASSTMSRRSPFDWTSTLRRS